MSTTESQKCYSTDDEEFNYSDPQEVFEGLDGLGELTAGTKLYAAPQHSPTAQSADSVPAVSDLPPLPAPDLRDVGTKPQEIKEFLKGYATEYARTAIAARAPADSVQEDAARYRFIRDVPYSDDVRSVLVHQQNAAMDRVIDAARKQGASHDR